MFCRGRPFSCNCAAPLRPRLPLNCVGPPPGLPMVVQAPRGPFGFILPGSPITSTTTKITTCPSYSVALFASQFNQFWRAACARCFRVRALVLPPRTAPVLPRGLRISRSPCLKRVLSRVPPRTQSRGCYSAAVLLVPMFSQSAMQRWLGGRRTVQRCQAREETTTKATTKKITSGVVVMRRRRHLLCRLDDGTGRSMARHWGMRSGRTPCLNVWALAMECSSRTTAR